MIAAQENSVAEGYHQRLRSVLLANRRVMDQFELFRNESDVESQESGGHLILSDTLFPRSFSSFSA